MDEMTELTEEQSTELQLKELAQTIRRMKRPLMKLIGLRRAFGPSVSSALVTQYLSTIQSIVSMLTLQYDLDQSHILDLNE